MGNEKTRPLVHRDASKHEDNTTTCAVFARERTDIVPHIAGLRTGLGYAWVGVSIGARATV